MVAEASRTSPTKQEVKDVRNKLTQREVQRLVNRVSATQVKDEWPENVIGPVTEEKALKLLNEAVRTRIPAGGRHGLIRCWCLFREKACASNNGVTFPEFEHALHSLALPYPPPLTQKLFNRMDYEKSGTISCQAFLDIVMSRWDAASTSVGGIGEGRVQTDPGSAESVAQRARDPAQLVTELAKFNDKEEVSYALGLLRQKIVTTLGNGAKSGVMRMWTEFRRRCCATVDGVTFPEFQTGLKLYGLSVSEKVQVAMFNSIDVNESGNIQIFEFIDNLMGRWDANCHTLPGVGAEEEKLIQAFAEEVATAKLDQTRRAKILRQAEKAERDKKRAAKKIRETPIWAKTTAANSTRFGEQAAARTAAAKSLRVTQSEKVLRPLMRPALSVERMHYPGDTPPPSWSAESQKTRQQRQRKQQQKKKQQQQQQQQATDTGSMTDTGTATSKWEPPWWDQTERQRQIMQEKERVRLLRQSRSSQAFGVGDRPGTASSERRPSTARRRPRSAGASRSIPGTPLVGEEFDLMRAIS